MRREDAIKNELKKLHTVYIAPYYLDYISCNLDPIASAKAFKTRKAARRYVREMIGTYNPDDYICKLDFEL